MTRKLQALGEEIAALRQGKRWSQNDLAQEANVTRSWVKMLEAGAIDSPGAAKLVRLALALDTAPEHFLDLAGASLYRSELAERPEVFDPDVVALAQDLQRLPPRLRQSSVRICKAYVTLQSTVQRS